MNYTRLFFPPHFSACARQFSKSCWRNWAVTRHKNSAFSRGELEQHWRQQVCKEGVKRALFFFSLFSYRSFNDLRCFLRRLMSLKLCTSTPSACSMNLLLMERRASRGHSWNRPIAVQLTMAGNFRARAHSVAPAGEKHRTIRGEEGGKRERKESHGKLRRSKKGMQRTMARCRPVQSWGSKPNLSANKLRQLPWANKFYSLSTVQTQRTCSFLPLSPRWYRLLGLIAINNNAATGTGWHADSQKAHVQLVTVTQTQFLSCYIYSSRFPPL